MRRGETVYESSCYGVYCRMSCFTEGEAAIGARVIQLRNEDRVERTLTLLHTCIFSPGNQPAASQLTALSRVEGGVLAENPSLEGVAGLFGMDPASHHEHHHEFGRVPRALGRGACRAVRRRKPAQRLWRYGCPVL